MAIDLSQYVTRLMNFEGCDPVIAEALRQSVHVKVRIKDTFDTFIVSYAVVNGNSRYLTKDHGWVDASAFALILDNTPREGDGKMYMLWSDDDEICTRVALYYGRTGFRHIARLGYGDGKTYQHCAVADLELMKHPISEWKVLRPDLEVF